MCTWVLFSSFDNKLLYICHEEGILFLLFLFVLYNISCCIHVHIPIVTIFSYRNFEKKSTLTKQFVFAGFVVELSPWNLDYYCLWSNEWVYDLKIHMKFGAGRGKRSLINILCARVIWMILECFLIVCIY